jgi:hypothetical protein
MALEFRTKFWSAMKDGPQGVGTKISERYFNPIWQRIDTRLHALEEKVIDWVKATEDLITFGLQRIDVVLAPAFERVGRIATLGFLIAHSTTLETLVQDEVSTFVVDDPDERELFHPSAFVTIAKPGSQEDFAVAQVLSYNRVNGVLDVTIREIFGSPGPHADWEISTGSGVPLLMRQQLADARSARDLSKDWAEKANNTDVNGVGTRSAKHHSFKAEGYATEAKDARDVTNAAAILIAGGPVSSVNGETGSVTLTAADVGAMSAADGDALQTEILDSVDTSINDMGILIDAALGDFGTTLTSGLAGKEPLWGVPAVVAGNATLTNRQHTVFDTAAAVRTATLPASPAAGTTVRIQRRGENNVVIARNGQTIRGEAADFTIDTNHICLEFRFGTTWDWF